MLTAEQVVTFATSFMALGVLIALALVGVMVDPKRPQRRRWGRKRATDASAPEVRSPRD